MLSPRIAQLGLVLLESPLLLANLSLQDIDRLLSSLELALQFLLSRALLLNDLVQSDGDFLLLLQLDGFDLTELEDLLKADVALCNLSLLVLQGRDLVEDLRVDSLGVPLELLKLGQERVLVDLWWVGFLAQELLEGHLVIIDLSLLLLEIVDSLENNIDFDVHVLKGLTDFLLLGSDMGDIRVELIAVVEVVVLAFPWSFQSLLPELIYQLH